MAVDIGASSGRHILGHIESGKLICEEVYRFPNGMVEKDGTLCWDLDTLFEEILLGMKRCAELGKAPVSVGIDTWGVDFVLLDENNRILGNTVAYRDSRTVNMDEAVYQCMPERELYARSGIPRQMFNTIFQLMAVKKSGLLKQAKTLLLVPDYLHYLLSGAAKTEYSIASTTGLLNAAAREWDDEIINACGYPRDIFQEIVPPGTCLGSLTPDIRKRVGFGAKVVVPAAHDTGSAVLAVPSVQEDILFISSGTWSVMGAEQSSPDCSAESMARDFANEGGYGYRTIYLKNIMGLWMIQSVKKELDDAYNFKALCDMAEKADIPSIVDCNDNRFFAPESMMNELKKACEESGQPIPQNPGELAAVIYNSLAMCYSRAVKELEQLTDIEYPAIHVIGGGANAGYLNELTARYTGKTVCAGPSEATAIGNVLAQMIYDGQFADVCAARSCVKDSFVAIPCFSK